MLARRASYDKKTLARQVIPLAPGYRTALSSHPAVSVSPTDGNGPTQGQRKTLTRVGIFGLYNGNKGLYKRNLSSRKYPGFGWLRVC